MNAWADPVETIRACVSCGGFYFIEGTRGTQNRRKCFVCSPEDERRRESWRLSKRRHYVANKIRRAIGAASAR